LPEPEQVLQRWMGLLKQHGRLILIEGCWGSDAGLHMKAVTAMLPHSFAHISTQDLSKTPDFWGHEVTDERYAIIADMNS
jgi:hypothetical protein